jgi:Uncharacterized protein conserved in bacteria
MKPENLCMGCMNELKNEEDICPECGSERGEAQQIPFLPMRTIIGSRYTVGKSLEINGEGISYIGYDKVKGSRVYIREFFPENLCSRCEDRININIAPHKKGEFEKEFQKFLKYFRSVARLRNIPALCAIYDMFEENKTAYIIMEWIDGTPLDKFVAEKGGSIPWNEAKTMFMPLLSALSSMHSAKVLHLGIAPSNVLVEYTGKMRLTGFATSDLRKMNSPLEPELYDGCSALEQYIDIYDMDQSTDVYGLTASLFLALTGEYPPTATKRKKDDRLFMPKNIVKSISNSVVSGIASGLRVYPNNRTFSFDRLKLEISDSEIAQFTLGENKKSNLPKEKRKNDNLMLLVKSCVATLSVLILCLVFYNILLKNNSNHGLLQNDNSTQNLNSEEESEKTSGTHKKIVIPDLREKSFEEIKNLNSVSEDYEVLLLSEEFNDDIKEGNIISQTPGAGEEANEGVIIAVTISKGSKTRKLPSVKEKTISEAAIAVSSAGLKPVESWSTSSNIPEGYVIDYSEHKEGDVVEYGSEIVLVRSSGQ